MFSMTQVSHVVNHTTILTKILMFSMTQVSHVVNHTTIMINVSHVFSDTTLTSRFLMFSLTIQVFLVCLHFKCTRSCKQGLLLWCLMPFSTIFQLYRGSDLLVEETGEPGENHQPVASH